LAKWIIAHRGDHSVEPENSLAAFEAAVNAGADMIEFDVRRLGDGTLVVHHDPETGGRPLGELTFAAMHETVPTL
jgi:glycerophosphoryl diester phosphodiesterase